MFTHGMVLRKTVIQFMKKLIHCLVSIEQKIMKAVPLM